MLTFDFLPSGFRADAVTCELLKPGGRDLDLICCLPRILITDLPIYQGAEGRGLGPWYYSRRRKVSSSYKTGRRYYICRRRPRCCCVTRGRSGSFGVVWNSLGVTPILAGRLNPTGVSLLERAENPGVHAWQRTSCSTRGFLQYLGSGQSRSG